MVKFDPAILHELSDFQAWKRNVEGGAPFSLQDYVGCVMTPDLLFACAELFWPQLIMHDGHYFIASGFEPEIYEDWQNRLDDPVDIQKIMNHIHIGIIFQNQDVTLGMYLEAANLIAEFWTSVFSPLGLVGHAGGEIFEDISVTLFAKPPG